MRYTPAETMAQRMVENMRAPGWLLPVMRVCPRCKQQAKHPRGDGCEKCLGVEPK